MSARIFFGVSNELMDSVSEGGWYLTVSRVDSVVLYEGPLDELGVVEVLVSVPCGTKSVKALLESSTKYRHAVVDLSDDGMTTHTFV